MLLVGGIQGYPTTTFSWTLGTAVSAAPLLVTPTSVDVGARVTLAESTTGGSPYVTVRFPALPGGCTPLPPSSVTCVPTAPGTLDVSASVGDPATRVVIWENASVVVSEPIGGGVLNVTPSALDLGGAISIELTSVNGAQPLTFRYVGLPAGCISPNSAVFSCTPSVAGSNSIGGSVIDASGRSTNATDLLLVRPDPVLAPPNPAPAPVDVGQAVAFAFRASLGAPPYTYSYPGLPTGCDGSPGGVVSCLSTTSGTLLVLGQVTDAEGVTAQSVVRITVNPLPAIVALVPEASVVRANASFNVTATVSGGTAPLTFLFSASPGACTLVAATVASCFGAAPGNLTVAVTVRDATSAVATSAIEVAVTPAPATPHPMPTPSPTTSSSFLNAGSASILLVGAVATVTIAVVALRRRRRRAR